VLKNWNGTGFPPSTSIFHQRSTLIFIFNTALSKRTRERSLETYKQMLFQISGSPGQFQVVFLFFKGLIKGKLYVRCIGNLHFLKLTLIRRTQKLVTDETDVRYG